MERSDGGSEDCRRAGKVRRSSAAVCCFWPRRTLFWRRRLKKRNPDRAAQFYANNAARVMAVRPGGKGEVSQTNIAWSERRGVPGVPSPLYYNGRLYTFQNGGIVFCRVAKTGELVYSGRLGALGYYYSSPVAADQKDLHCIRRGRGGGAGCRRQVECTGHKQARRRDPGHTGISRRQHLRENRKSPVRFWKVNMRLCSFTALCSKPSQSALASAIRGAAGARHDWLPGKRRSRSPLTLASGRRQRRVRMCPHWCDA